MSDLEQESTDGQLLSVLQDTADFLYRHGVGEGAAAVDEIARWIDMYGEPEEWAKRAQAAHNRAEGLSQRLTKATARVGLADRLAEAAEAAWPFTYTSHQPMLRAALRAYRRSGS